MDHLRRKVCWNTKCPATNSNIWKQGWRLQSGRTADLCDYCGLIFEQSRFCETFHSDDAGWRTCNFCRKRVHCGCIASVAAFIHLDFGGVECVDCSRKELSSKLLPQSKEISSNVSSESTSLTRACSLKLSDQSSEDEPAMSMSGSDRKRKHVEDVGGHTEDGSLNNGKVGRESVTQSPRHLRHGVGDLGTCNLPEEPVTPACPADTEKSSRIPCAVSTQSQVSQTSAEFAKVVGTDGKNHQVLLRYLPQGSDKEIQQATDGNSTIVPLFEKMLTASDAGRIGRLVLPKACAEAFFPPISIPEGIPIKMTDVMGQEWQFQFRFWPNNSSRMYVLEGITPCVKAMQLQAGDVVTFSRMEPGGKMIMGYRRNSSSKSKNSKNASCKDNSGAASGNQNGESGSLISNLIKTKESLFGKSGKTDDGLDRNKRNQKEAGSPLLNGSSMRIPDNSKASSVPSRTAWEEAQDLLTPPPGVTPSIMTIDGHRFEEYEEPPVLARKVIGQHPSAVFASSYASPLPG